MLYIKRAVDKEMRKALKDFVNAHHSYIKWADRPSRKMYWGLYEDDKLVGCFGLASAYDRPKAVKEFMATHGIAFNEIGNNIVYCLYGYNSQNVGTQFLKLVRHDARLWWKERYGDDLKALQTFILPPRSGALYKADNWEQLGSTTGGSTIKVRTLYGEDREKYKDSPNLEIRKFNSGEIKYLLREHHITEPKLMFVKLLSKRGR